MTTFGLSLFPDAEELDFVGPWEVFTASSMAKELAARWVRDGSIVSSQGVSAGIDMALWVIGRIESPAHARRVQRYIQYDPAPPDQADV